MGYTPVNIKAKTGRWDAQGAQHPGVRQPGRAQGDRSLQPPVRHPHQSGLTLIRSLTILTTQTESPALAKVVIDVRSQVERGISLSQAMNSHPKVFNRLFVSMVRAGEASGGLDQSLVNLANMLEKQASLRSKVKSAMAYPVAVLVLVC